MAKFWNTNFVVGIATSTFVAGVAVGYKLTDVHLRKYYDDLAIREKTFTQDFYQKRFRLETIDMEQRLRSEAIDERLQAQAEEEKMIENFDYEKEMEIRASTHRYIVSEDEFFEQEDRSSLTYYEGSDTLTDDKDDILDLEDFVGRENLKFGYGSNDPNVVFIRNEKYDMWAEVTRAPQSWEEMQEDDNSYVGEPRHD